MLDLDSRKLWDKDRKMVKNFQACQYFFDAILDAHLTASVASTLGIRDRYPELLAFIRSDQFDAGTLSAHITVIAERIAQSTAIKRMRELPREYRDPEFENHLMFMQHGLILRQFIHAMRHGDSGRVLASLSFFTVWFQASGKHKYASETMHLTACLKKIWSAGFREFWMQNCLINPSGRAEGWVACDYLGEYVVREVKNMMHNNLNSATGFFLRETVSRLIMSFRNIRKKMMSECDYNPSDKSSRVGTHSQVALVMDDILGARRCEVQEGRQNCSTSFRDLYGNGLDALSGGRKIAAYVAKLWRDGGHVDRMEEFGDSEELDVDRSQEESSPLEDEREDEWIDEQIM